MKIEVLHPKSLKTICEVDLSESQTVGDLKNAVESKKKSLYPDRQMIKADPTGKGLKDDETIGELIKKYPTDGVNFKVYLKDLGPQVGWTTVFLTEYAGPLFIYLIFYFRPSFIYSSFSAKSLAKYEQVQHIACFCWTFHYAKRLLETIFVHRFSHATMPILNIFKNSAYYWGFTALVAYYVNHPLYTKASFGDAQVYLGLALFMINEFGNYSIHIALRDLRPPGTRERNIPRPTSNPFTMLFRYVSCPNYTYEIYSWISFTIMTQTLTAGLFAFVGAAQMTVWALGKHRNYRKEFKEYPRGRKAIIPFLI
jgi:very-long-chain enoyl-CoA reductase